MGEISTSIERIDPVQAAAYLDLNVADNRAKKPHKIREFARDMVAGRWKVTGEAIKFLEDGRMCDGQNRMHAVILAGVAADFLVVRGLAYDAMGPMDSGAIRTGGDVLTIFGLSDGPGAKDLATTAAVHKAWTSGDLAYAMASISGQTRMTRLEMADYVAANPDLRYAAAAGRHMYRHLRLPIGAMATAFITLRAIDLPAAEDFFGRIRDGRSDGPGDPLLTLQRRVNNDLLVGGINIFPGTALFYLFRSWNAVRRNEPLSKLQLGSASGGWAPIPKPI